MASESSTGWPFADLLGLSTTTLATIGEDGEPHAAAVFFAARPDLRMYFFSDPISQHAQDLAVNSRAALAIHPHTRGWRSIRGLQLRGRVEKIEPGIEWDAAWELYRQKFRFVRLFGAVVARNMLYGFQPYWVRWTDNRRGFGWKREWTLE